MHTRTHVHTHAHTCTLRIEEQYETLQEEIEHKSKKYDKLKDKYQQSELELKERTAEFQQDKEELVRAGR